MKVAYLVNQYPHVSHSFIRREIAALEPFGDRALRAQMADLAEAGLDPSGVAATLAELAALVGFVNLELSGHFVGTADPADRLFDALVRRQCATLRLGDSVRP